jgi:hypothetical protein
MRPGLGFQSGDAMDRLKLGLYSGGKIFIMDPEITGLSSAVGSGIMVYL